MEQAREPTLCPLQTFRGWSLRRSIDKLLQSGGFVPACKGLKCLSPAQALGQIDPQQLFNGGGTVLRLHVVPDFFADSRVRAVATAHHNMEPLHGIAFVVDCDLAANEPDVANVMLRARIEAAREVDIDWLVDSEPRFEMGSDALGGVLGILVCK